MAYIKHGVKDGAELLIVSFLLCQRKVLSYWNKCKINMICRCYDSFLLIGRKQTRSSWILYWTHNLWKRHRFDDNRPRRDLWSRHVHYEVQDWGGGLHIILLRFTTRILDKGSFIYWIQVLLRANRSQYGLAAGVWTRSLDTANRFSRNLRAGTVWYDNFDAAIPFGGYKMSGIGRDKGEYALEQYTQVKCVQTPLSGSNWH